MVSSSSPSKPAPTLPGRYFSILEAIANKRMRISEIASATGLPVTALPVYLKTLRDIGLVGRVVPATEQHEERSKNGSYRITDPFFRFWFHYVYANRSLLGRGAVEQVLHQVASTLDAFTSLEFEKICREHVWHLGEEGTLDFLPTTVGSWWTRASTHELDVLAMGDGHVLMGECKWSARPVDTPVLDALVAKGTEFARTHPSFLGTAEVRYALFSRAGFTPALRQRAVASGALLYDLADLCP